ncbi:hypothetical protein AV521_18555 [Streptomyces sp. IMTB 2501]|nr:hypothetical protein AV521_18555 [Streptomyces sp. IMTB 2501]
MTAALAAALTLVAAPLAASAATPSVAPKHRELSNKDNRSSLTVHKGDEITVRLSGEKNNNSTWGWSVPTAANGTVLHRDTARTAPNGDATGVFHARADGTTTLDSQFRCISRTDGEACSHVVISWQVTVTVRR